MLDRFKEEFNYTKAIEEKYNDNRAVRYTMLFPDEKMLLITLTEEHPGLVIYSYFINRELIASDFMDLEEFIKGFKEYIKS